ncbi:MAG: NAD(P)-dependent dehydrogenase (short-subunit alcohol dehydrogenase family) [Flavobacterium sp.]|jgi:NAD(P)-dependent dehydrogenase (short-subunit alcohol dehydrogenase family)
MKDKHVLITGGNSGIGKVAAIALARQGARIVLACKPSEKTELALEEISKESVTEAQNLPVDLSSLEAVRTLAETYQHRFERLDVLINNAGVFPVRQQLTHDGFEMQFGVNHLSHFLLTNLLLDQLKDASPSRVVTVSSMMHKKGSIDFDNFKGEKKYNSQLAYGQSKLANILFAFELAERLSGTDVTSTVLHPGGVRTDITRDLPWLVRKLINLIFISPDKGAATTIQLASDKALEGVSGKYFDQTLQSEPSPLANDKLLREKLWIESEKMTGLDARIPVA